MTRLRVLDTLEVHRRLATHLHRARSAAALSQTATARMSADEAHVLFQRHRWVEETVWMPLYEARCDPPENARPRVLLRDHRLIADLFTAATRVDGLDLVDVLEDLAGALEHHDLREQTWFKPLLDAALTESESAALVQQHDEVLQAERTWPYASTTEWRPPPRHRLTEPRRKALLASEVVSLSPLQIATENPAFGKKIRTLLDRIDLQDPVDALAKLRRIAMLLSADPTVD